MFNANYDYCKTYKTLENLMSAITKLGIDEQSVRRAMPIVVKEIKTKIMDTIDGELRDVYVMSRERGDFFIHPTPIDYEKGKPVFGKNWSISTKHGWRVATCEGVRNANKIADVVQECAKRNGVNLNSFKEPPTIMTDKLRAVIDLLHKLRIEKQIL